MSTEVYAALLGVLVGGLIQTVIAYFDRRRERLVILTAIVAEVNSISRLIRHRGYHTHFQLAVQALSVGEWPGHLSANIEQNYFSVFEALSPNIGRILPYHADKIVTFYAYCKAIIDSTRHDSPLAQQGQNIYGENNIIEVEQLLRLVLRIGDEISQFSIIRASTQ